MPKEFAKALRESHGYKVKELAASVAELKELGHGEADLKKYGISGEARLIKFHKNSEPLSKEKLKPSPHVSKEELELLKLFPDDSLRAVAREKMVLARLVNELKSRGSSVGPEALNISESAEGGKKVIKISGHVIILK